MPSDSPASRKLALRILARHATTLDTPGAAAEAGAQVCQQMRLALSQWVGLAGSDALIARAIADAQPRHEVLRNVRIGARSEPCLAGLSDSAREYGAREITDGVISMLAALIELLGRLIGDDMAMKLIEESVPARAPSEAMAGDEGVTA